MKGWGFTFEKFDALFKPYAEKLGKYSYHNFYPFKSESGKWYAFHCPQYSDIRIVELETGKVVVDKFYSNFDIEPSVYHHHTNASIYVPSYTEKHETYKDGRPLHYCNNDHDFDECEETLTLDMIKSIPVAFNAWTIWAADHEFYVDAIDLRRIDEGIIRKLDWPQKVISRSCYDVRDAVKADTDIWIAMRKEGESDEERAIRQSKVRPYTSFSFLIEEIDLRYQQKEDEGNEGFVDPTKNGHNFQPVEKLPWVVSQEWEIEYRRKQEEKKNGGTNSGS